MMNNPFFFLSFVLLIPFIGASQSIGSDDIRNQKGAFIAQYLELTTEEKEHFVSVFNEYENLRNSKRAREPKNYSALSEEQAQQVINDRFKREEDVIRFKKDFYDNLSQKITAKKLVHIRDAERAFNKKLLQELKNRKHNN